MNKVEQEDFTENKPSSPKISSPYFRRTFIKATLAAAATFLAPTRVRADGDTPVSGELPPEFLANQSGQSGENIGSQDPLPRPVGSIDASGYEMLSDGTEKFGDLETKGYEIRYEAKEDPRRIRIVPRNNQLLEEFNKAVAKYRSENPDNPLKKVRIVDLSHPIFAGMDLGIRNRTFKMGNINTGVPLFYQHFQYSDGDDGKRLFETFMVFEPSALTPENLNKAEESIRIGHQTPLVIGSYVGGWAMSTQSPEARKILDKAPFTIEWISNIENDPTPQRMHPAN